MKKNDAHDENVLRALEAAAPIVVVDSFAWSRGFAIGFVSGVFAGVLIAAVCWTLGLW